MGQRLSSYFALVRKEWGLPGQIRFAMLTKMSSVKAKEAEDSPENVALFERALEKLRREGI